MATHTKNGKQPTSPVRDPALGLNTPIGRRDFAVGLLLGGTAMATVACARTVTGGAASAASPSPTPPPIPGPDATVFANPPDAIPDGNNIYSLTLSYVDCQIWGQDARLLYYYDVNDPAQKALLDHGGTLDRPVVAPTVRVKQAPGQCAFMGIDLVNAIPFDAGNYFNYLYFGDDTPHGFSVTNLHTHGLHVNPDGNGDNVLREIWPVGTPDSYSAFCGTGPDYFHIGTNTYRYTFLPGHPVGSYWYHPHKHGSTAFQVANGLAGALIVEDTAHNLFTLFGVDQAQYQDRFEKTLIVQQISLYNPPGGGERSPVEPPGLKPGQAYVDATELYGLKVAPGQFEEGSPVSPRSDPVPTPVLTVNGQYVPTLTMASEEIQAWRLINTTWASDTIFTWSFEQIDGPDAPAPAAYAIGTDGNPLPASLIGRPVTELGALVQEELLTLAPGQRVDLVVQAPVVQAGQRVVYTLQARQYTAGGSGDWTTQPLLYVVVEGTVGAATQGYQPPTVMPEPAEFTALPRPEPVPIKVGNLRPPFNPDVLADNQQITCFSFLPVGNSAVNGSSFNPAGPQRTLPLDETSVWSVAGQQAPHVFHIHVNPFVLLARTSATGSDAAGEDGDDASVTSRLYPLRFGFHDGSPTVDGIFRDTLLIEPQSQADDHLCGLPTSLWSRPGTVFASYQRDFCGNYVMHCHVLDHEDYGMMEWVQVLDAQGTLCADPTLTACAALPS